MDKDFQELLEDEKRLAAILKLSREVNQEDFLVRIRPFTKKDGTWTGEVDISVMALPYNTLNDEDYEQVMHFSKMVCASVPVMHEIDELRQTVDEYVRNVIDNEDEIDIELEEEYVEKTYDDNVVHLKFNTKTKGSA